MLRVVPRGCFSWTFRIEDASGSPLAEVSLSAWRERGGVVAAQTQYRITRQGLTGPFVIEAAGQPLAHAVKVSAFRREFTVTHGSVHYTLRPASFWRQEYAVFAENGETVGRIMRESWWTRRSIVDLPESILIWLQAFLVWLVLLLWRRDAAAAA
jgi:hypothetical protein